MNDQGCGVDSRSVAGARPDGWGTSSGTQRLGALGPKGLLRHAEPRQPLYPREAQAAVPGEHPKSPHLQRCGCVKRLGTGCTRRGRPRRLQGQGWHWGRGLLALFKATQQAPPAPPLQFPASGVSGLQMLGGRTRAMAGRGAWGSGAGQVGCERGGRGLPATRGRKPSCEVVCDRTTAERTARLPASSSCERQNSWGAVSPRRGAPGRTDRPVPPPPEATRW